MRQPAVRHSCLSVLAWTWLACRRVVEEGRGVGKAGGGEGRRRRQRAGEEGGKLQQKQSISPTNCSSPKTRSSIHNPQCIQHKHKVGRRPALEAQQPRPLDTCQPLLPHSLATVTPATPVNAFQRFCACCCDIVCIFHLADMHAQSCPPGCVTPLIRPSADASGEAAAARVRMTCMKSGPGRRDGWWMATACVSCPQCPAHPPGRQQTRFSRHRAEGTGHRGPRLD